MQVGRGDEISVTNMGIDNFPQMLYSNLKMAELGQNM